MELGTEYVLAETRTYAVETYSYHSDDCPRCGNMHQDVVVTALYRPILDHESGMEWAWWAVCPMTGDPVLIANRPEDDSSLPPTLLARNPKESRYQ